MNAFSIALDSIWAHRLRSALTALGIVIGVFAVVTLTSLGSGVRSYVSGQFSSFGATLITVTPALPHASSQKPRFGGGPNNNFINVPSTLTVSDATAISSAHSPDISQVAPVAVLPVTVSLTPGGFSGLAATGTTSSYFRAQQLSFATGRFTRNGAVLGSSALHTLFPGVKNPIGRTIYVGQTLLPVTGVLNSASGLLSKAANNTIFVYVSTGLKISGLHNISEILVAASGNTHVNGAGMVIARVLTRRHPSRDFTVTKDTQILKTINNTLSTITTFLSGLAAISLLVGGIGIMNIMLVTVTERFREIGIRKALGARDSDILVQFLAESVLLSLLGGAIGVLLSALASHMIGQLAGFSAGLTLDAVALAVGFSLLVGIVFGVIPAFRAARLMPAEALRTE
jgi:putative ABC transport system permease protein